jgi:proline iminopeptidase
MKSIKTFALLALVAVSLLSCTKERMINEAGNLVPKTVDQDRSLSSITINGAMLHSEAFGDPDKPIVVVIHGGPGGDYRDLLNCRDLANHGYRVVFYDQRGSGLSQRFPKKNYTDLGAGAIDLMFDDLAAVIAHYRTKSTQKVFLIGYSWGAMLATGFAGKHTDAVQGLVLAEPGGLKWDDIEEFTKKIRAFNLWGEAFNDVAYLDQFMSGKEDQHEVLDYKFAMSAIKDEITGEDNTAPASFWRYGAVVNAALFKIGKDHHPDLSAGINNFHVPVLFFYSEKNKAYTDQWAQKIAGAFNTVKLTKIMGVGHEGIIPGNGAWSNQTMPAILNYFKSL